MYDVWKEREESGIELGDKQVVGVAERDIAPFSLRRLGWEARKQGR
jgi:hypothetical protein